MIEPITPMNPTALVLAWFDRRRHWLWLALGLIYVIGFNGQWRIGPDSAIHITLARSLAQCEGFIHPTGLEHTVNPGLGYLTAATFRLFDVDQFYAINALMLISAVIVLVLTYWTVRLRFDRPTAVLAVCMLGINETFYRYGYQALTDMPFLLGLMLLLLGNELLNRKDTRLWTGACLIGASIIVMALFRSVVVTVVAAGILMAIYRAAREPGGKRYAIGAVLIGCVLLIMRWFTGGGALMRDEGRVLGQITDTPIADTLHRVFIQNGPALLTENLPEAVFAIDFGTALSLPIGVGLIVIGVALFRVRPLWGILVGVFIAQWLLFITTERYILVLIPLLALAWWRIGLWADTRFKPATTRYILAVILAMWFGPNLVRIGAFIVEQRSQPFLSNYDDGRYAALQAVADELASLAEPGDVLIANHAPQLTYYTQLPVFGPMTLPTYGPDREDTVNRIREAQRILMVGPIDDNLNDRVKQLKLKQVQVLSIVPTPVYDRQPEYKIIQMHIRSADWDNFRQRRERRLNATRKEDGSDTTETDGSGSQPMPPGAAQQSDGHTEQQSRDAE